MDRSWWERLKTAIWLWSCGLSGRRGILRRPKVCRPSPPSSSSACADPPNDIGMWVRYSFPWYGGTEYREFHVTVTREPDGSWWWDFDHTPTEPYSVDFYITTGDWMGSIHMLIEDDLMGDIQLTSYGFPIIPCISVAYSVDEWRELPDPAFWCLVVFST